jgi:hypothetical protein
MGMATNSNLVRFRRPQIGYTFYGDLRPEWFGCYSAAMITLTQVWSSFEDSERRWEERTLT